MLKRPLQTLQKLAKHGLQKYGGEGGNDCHKGKMQYSKRQLLPCPLPSMCDASTYHLGERYDPVFLGCLSGNV